MYNIYDFDKTIYAGDSTIDFYVFAILKKPILLKYIPKQLWHIIKYSLKLENKDTFKGNFLIFIKDIEELDNFVGMFWMAKKGKINKWYLDRPHNDDVIISASPEFLLKSISESLGVYKLIATRVDIKTGKLIGKNCFGQTKLIRYKKEIGDVDVNECYSDSMSDLPIFKIADRAYLVRGSKISLLNIE